MDSPLALIAESARPELATRYMRDEVRRYSERALGGGAPLLDDEALVARHVVALAGLGRSSPT